MHRTTYKFLGLSLQALTAADVVSITSQTIKKAERHIIANHNLHSLYIYHHDAKARRFFDQADYVHADGMAIVALGRLLRIPLRHEHRATYVDLLPLIFAEAEQQGWKIFYLGSKPDVVKRAVRKIRTQFPGLQIRARHGHFNADNSSSEKEDVLAEINAYSPQILMVGMGMPRQEHWIADNWQALHCNAAFCCGAALDYIAGEIPTPPRWLGQFGVEWIFRLWSEPKRLWRRYLIEPWFVLVVLSRHYLAADRPRPRFR